MNLQYVAFWTVFDEARRYAFSGNYEVAAQKLRQAKVLCEGSPPDVVAERMTLLQKLAELLEFPLQSQEEHGATAGLKSSRPSEPLEALGPISAQGTEGISLVTCAMNRTENLMGALTSWVACPELSEILIVDWSSAEPVAAALQRAGFNDPRIRVVRVDGEPRWILSYAFNIGFRLARHQKILKADADIVLMSDFFERNRLPEAAFIAGNWRRVTEGQAYVNGFFFANRADLASVAGFNEFITTYGWDDDDLYARLIEHGTTRIDVVADTIHHQTHSDAERTGEELNGSSDAYSELTAGTMFKIRRNRFIANVMPHWRADKIHLPFIKVGTSHEAEVFARRGDIPHTVPDQIARDADHYALQELASWHLGPDVLTLDRDTLKELLSRPLEKLRPEDVLAAGQAKLLVSSPVVQRSRARIFIDAQHGLGNRLRAIGSAGAIAAATDRELVVVWEPDAHCEGRLSDLFEYNGAVIEEAFIHNASHKGCHVYNYMEVEAGAEKDAPLDLTWSGDIYARAAYVLNAPPSKWKAENNFLKKLRPVAEVRELVSSVRTPNNVSAHIRMAGGAEYEHLPYEALQNWTEEGHAQIEFWRKKSHFSHFVKRIDTLISEGRADRIFLAADKPETYEAFQKNYGERVTYLPRDLYDRSAEQLRYALADALLLGSAPLLLGSTWSSFSELATRLSPQEMTVEMSGHDF